VRPRDPGAVEAQNHAAIFVLVAGPHDRGRGGGNGTMKVRVTAQQRIPISENEGKNKKRQVRKRKRYGDGGFLTDRHPLEKISWNKDPNGKSEGRKEETREIEGKKKMVLSWSNLDLGLGSAGFGAMARIPRMMMGTVLDTAKLGGNCRRVKSASERVSTSDNRSTSRSDRSMCTFRLLGHFFTFHFPLFPRCSTVLHACRD